MNSEASVVGTWRSMPVYIKKIGSKKVVVDSELRREVLTMRELRHPKLVEFIGVCITRPNICVVTGMLATHENVYDGYKQDRRGSTSNGIGLDLLFCD